MSDQKQIQNCYDKIVQRYTIQASDSEVEMLRKLLANNQIDTTLKDSFIAGLKQLVTDLRQKINEFENKLKSEDPTSEKE